MKSIKFLLTSVVCLIFSISFLFIFTTEETPIPGMIGFYGFLAAFLVFFILGWIVKDKPKPPCDTENDKDTKK